VYVVENNGYGEATPMEFVTPMRDLAERAAAYSIPGVIANGMDFFDVHEKAGQAIERARRGEGPTLLECKTYRYFGHYVGDPLTYRTKEEADEVRRSRDALDIFEQRVTTDGGVQAADLRRIDGEVAAKLEEAVSAAEQAPFPDADDLLTDVYVNG
jgi:pyruvate dehydrogenase E1 component alpha subunit